MATPTAIDRVTCLGAGRLGLSWSLCVERAGIEVKCVDIFPTYVQAINDRTLRSHEPLVADMLRASTRLSASLSVKEGAAFSQHLYIFVQTPSSGGDRHYDHTHLSDVLSQLNALKVTNKHIVICCTVMPGYIDTIVPTLLPDCCNCTVSYSPEFIAQGAIIAGTLAPDVVLIGEGSAAAGDAIEALTKRYVTNTPRVCRMSPGSAEIAKLGLNTFITLKIAFANFVGDLADAADAARLKALATSSATSTAAHNTVGSTAAADASRRVDKRAIAEAIGSDSRVGLKCLLPGYGFGGPCFPRDGRALAGYAALISSASHPLDATLALAPSQANDAHAHFQAKRLVALADDAVARGARACTIVFDDVTFKPRCAVPIVQESAKLVVARKVTDTSPHRVAIRERRADVLDAVKRDHGLVFSYWQLGSDGTGSSGQAIPPGDDASETRADAGSVGDGGAAGHMAYIIADRVLLPPSPPSDVAETAASCRVVGGGGAANGASIGGTERPHENGVKNKKRSRSGDVAAACEEDEEGRERQVGEPTAAERRGEGRASLPTSFTT